MSRALSLLGATGAAVLIAACSSNGNGPDERCHGVAQVPAWDVAYTVTYNDTGTARDTFYVAQHHAVDGSGTTGPAARVTTYDGVAWFTIHPAGTLAVHDTVIDPVQGDTTVGVATLLTPHPQGDGTFSGGYVAIDLAQCTADIGALFYAQMPITIDGVSQGTDTLRIGYSQVRGLAVDSAFVAGGWTFPAAKVATRAGAYDFVHDSQYLALSLSGRYAPGVNTDSATISFIVTPASTPGTVSHP